MSITVIGYRCCLKAGHKKPYLAHANVPKGLEGFRIAEERQDSAAIPVARKGRR